MLNLLLVDDEKLELEALQQYIDWKKLGIHHVYTAKNGYAAYDIFLENEIHIIITDIKMPVMDGITLAKKIADMKTGSKIVFLSGYDDFEYMKAAMDVAAVDYIKKPFQVEEVERVMEKVKHSIEEDQMVRKSMDVMENKLMETLCTSKVLDPSLIAQVRKIHPGNNHRFLYGMVQVYGIFQQNVPDIIKGMMSEIEYGFVCGNSILFLLASYVNFLSTANRIIENMQQISGKNCFAVYIKNGVALEELSKNFQILSSYEKIMFYEEVGNVFEVKDQLVLQKYAIDERKIEKLINKLLDMVIKSNFDHREEILNELFGTFRVVFMSRAEVKKWILRIFLKIEDMKTEACNEIRNQNFFQNMTSEFDNIFYFKDYEECIKTLFEKMAAYCAEKETGKNFFVVNRVKEYIYNHYADQITMEAIEEEIHLSKNYIRSIYKETTGQTILEFITNYRMEEACKLLKDPTIKIMDVSARVGYPNVPYFCTIFTKRYKESPNEYRKHFI